MKLISMTDFVTDYIETGCAVSQIKKMSNYAKFLKQPLKLEMFIPCDEKGNVLKQPNHYRRFISKDFLNENPKMSEKWIKECQEYQIAERKILFKNFDFFIEHDGENCVMTEGFVLSILSLLTMKIEDIVDNDIELTRFGISKVYE